MILIIGGRGQGKLNYVRNRYKSEKIACELIKADVIYGLHDIIKKLLSDGKDPLMEVLRHTEDNPHTIYICDEVGCGVVPVDPDERQWRESVGRVCVEIASRADRVERVFCGLAMTLKNNMSE